MVLWHILSRWKEIIARFGMVNLFFIESCESMLIQDIRSRICIFIHGRPQEQIQRGQLKLFQIIWRYYFKRYLKHNDLTKSPLRKPMSLCLIKCWAKWADHPIFDIIGQVLKKSKQVDFFLVGAYIWCTLILFIAPSLFELCRNHEFLKCQRYSNHEFL